MTILHITETAEGASGVATFVRELDASLRAQGVESHVAAGGSCSGRVDVIHIHGLWLPRFHKAAQWAMSNGIPVVWSTHGMTAPWSMGHKRLKKLLAWALYQRRDLRGAAAVHCTTGQEAEWNRALGFGNCFIAPLGTRLQTEWHLSASGYRLLPRTSHILLFVGRIHPVKGLVNLIKAWGEVKRRGNDGTGDWKLRLVGPDEAGHLAELERLVRESGLEGGVEFPGPKFGAELEAEYESCDCLVLPSFTENFGATVVDAMAHGRPCIASTFTPWRELQERGCGWWVSNEPKKLADVICDMIGAGDDRRREMGAKGRRLVEEKYTWAAVAETMAAKYKEICDGR